MADIAEELGISVNTVSRALNNLPEISQETKGRVLEVATRIGYMPNKLARSLATRRTDTVGVVVSDNGNPFYARLLKGIEAEARANDYDILLCNSDEKAAQQASVIRSLISRRVDGMLVTLSPGGERDIEVLHKAKVPFVLANRRTGDDSGIDYVVGDNEFGLYEATRYLVELGHKRICYLTGPRPVSSVRERVAGFKRALEEAGLGRGCGAGSVIYCKLRPDDFFRRACEVLSAGRDSRPTAVLAYDDLFALDVYRAARKLGISIPGELSVVGYDDVVFAEYVSVALTTVHQPSYSMGRRAMALLVSRLRNKGGQGATHTVMKPRLVVRASCSRPPEV